jgi:signal transduction histidine kinase
MKDPAPTPQTEATEGDKADKLEQFLQAQRLAEALLEAQRIASIDGILFIDNCQQVAFYNQRFCEIWKIPAALIQIGDEQPLLKFVLDQLEEFLAKIEHLYQHPQADSRDEIVLKHGGVLERRSAESRPAIEIIKQYSQLPQVECYAGQLNQVFMNLLSHAI